MAQSGIHRIIPRGPFSALAALALAAGCVAEGPGPDAAELVNMHPANIVPKSSSAALVAAFDRYCVNAAPTAAAQEAGLRAAGYVPTRAAARNGARLYLVDDRRPAVAVSSRMCLVQAHARTGQTDRARRYVAGKFPDARPLDPSALGTSIEQAWAVPDAIVATGRYSGIANHSRYSIILFRPGEAGAP